MRRRARNGASLADRLALHSVEAPSGCLIWTGARDKRSGYGRVWVQGKVGYAHRVSYEVHIGPIPTGLEINHLCRRTACIRPHHLQAVTRRINVRRGTSPGAVALRRDVCKYGHPYSDFGVVRAGRRVCRICRKAYAAEWHRLGDANRYARMCAGLPAVDLDAVLKQSAPARDEAVA